MDKLSAVLDTVKEHITKKENLKDAALFGAATWVAYKGASYAWWKYKNA